MMEELAKRFADLAEKVGPQAMEAARGAVRVEAYSSMSSAIIMAIFAGALLYSAKKLWSHQTEDEFDRPFPKVGSAILAFIGLCFACGVLWTFIDPWVWVAINNPDLYLAKKVLKL